eukprot:2004104-Pleurochrysis_carterae.AAC.1
MKIDDAAQATFTAESDAAESLKRSATAQNEATKRARRVLYADQMRYQVAMDLAQLRYVKLVATAHVDIMKGCVTNWLLIAADAIISDVNAQLSAANIGPMSVTFFETIASSVRSKLDIFNGLRTVYLESKFLQKFVPMVSPTRRVMPPTAIKRAFGVNPHDEARVQLPPLPKSMAAYDFALDELLARLVEHSAPAREAIYDTVVSWSAKPSTRSEPMRIVADVTDGRVFADHPVFGLRARVSREEAEKASATASLKIAIMLYAAHSRCAPLPFFIETPCFTYL